MAITLETEALSNDTISQSMFPLYALPLGNLVCATRLRDEGAYDVSCLQEIWAAALEGHAALNPTAFRCDILHLVRAAWEAAREKRSRDFHLDATQHRARGLIVSTHSIKRPGVRLMHSVGDHLAIIVHGQPEVMTREHRNLEEQDALDRVYAAQSADTWGPGVSPYRSTRRRSSRSRSFRIVTLNEEAKQPSGR